MRVGTLRNRAWAVRAEPRGRGHFGALAAIPVQSGQ